MPQIDEISRFLLQIGEADQCGLELYRLPNNDQLIGINSVADAKAGEISWLSHKTYLKNPTSVASFNGTLLIVPKGLSEHEIPSNKVISCKHPKLAFIKVVNTFFSYLTRTEWPRLGDNPVYPMTVIGEQVTLCRGVVIGSGVVIEDRVVVGPNTVLANCTLSRNSRIGANCTIGLPGFGFALDELGSWWRFPHSGRVIVGENVEIGSNTCIDRGSIGDTLIGKGTKVDNLVHVAHNVVIGDNCLLIANSMIGGSVTIGDNVWVAPSVSIKNKITVSSNSLLGMGSVLLEDVLEYSVIAGNPGKLLRKTNFDDFR